MKGYQVKNGLILVIVIVFLSGCLYPKDKLAKNQIPNEQQLEMVQKAIDTYREQYNGLVPIRTKDSATSVYEKYLIDFSQLLNENFIHEIPGTAYESGGVYQYALLTPEENPRVKLIDLRVTEQLRSVNVKLNMYRSKHTYPPFGEQIAKNVFALKYEELNLKEAPYVISPYSGEKLPIVLNNEGKLFVDYTYDLFHALREFPHEYVEGDNILNILPENYPFLPVYSLPYTILDGEPVFNLNN